jgi:hypothetical protein
LLVENLTRILQEITDNFLKKKVKYGFSFSLYLLRIEEQLTKSLNFQEIVIPPFVCRYIYKNNDVEKHDYFFVKKSN